jgi:hypothetical protein
MGPLPSILSILSRQVVSDRGSVAADLLFGPHPGRLVVGIWKTCSTCD